ncbi:MAG: hypothetical protein EXS14_08120 [Planctomycetes bacterium]|nr:hypothetical protein [Planctomycetota bacterium]
MRNWNILAALLAVALVVPASFAQSTDSVSKDLRELKARVAALEVENSALKGANDGAALEGQVNALAERFSVGTAAPKVTFSGEFRARYATKFVTGPDAWDIANLARIGFGYDIGNGISMRVDMQTDWNLGTGVGTGALSPSIYQAYGNWSNFLGVDGLGMRLGRQELAFGNQFAWGVDDWNTGNNSDLINFSYGTESVALNLVYDLNSTAGAGGHNQNYLLYVAIKSLKDMTVEAYYQSSDQNIVPITAVGNRYGAHFAGSFGGLGLDANLDVQEDTGGADDTFAYEVTADYDVSKDLGLFARWYSAEDGYDFTGNRHSNTGYRARYGLADAFVIDGTNGSDVFSLQVGASFACGSGWTSGATVAFFDQDADALNAGTEVDVWAEHACADNATLGAGIAFLSPDVGDNDTFLYVQARIAF